MMSNDYSCTFDAVYKKKVSYIERKSYPRLTLSARLGQTSRNTCSIKGCLKRKKFLYYNFN